MPNVVANVAAFEKCLISLCGHIDDCLASRPCLHQLKPGLLLEARSFFWKSFDCTARPKCLPHVIGLLARESVPRAMAVRSENQTDDRAVRTARQAVAQFGSEASLGGNSRGTRKAGTWQWDGATWTQLHISGPLARSEASMVTLGDKLVLFGGEGASGMPSDTWTFDGAAWTQQNVSGPPAREAAAAAAVGSQVVLFDGDAGINSSDLFGDTWIWSGASWSQQNSSGPPARSDATAIGL